MPETFIVTVTIDGGEWLIQKKISSELLCTSLQLSQLFNPYLSALKVIGNSETLLGFGTGQSVLDSSSPTPL